MVITPNSKIILLQNDLEIDNKNQLTFANLEAQLNYFQNLPNKKEYPKLTYIRENGTLTVTEPYDNLVKYNYCMYQNTSFSNKWYFAYIVKMEYLTHNSTALYILTDVWQTYQFDINILSSFVEREHINPNDDIPGTNLVPESLEIGEPKIDNTYNINELEPYYVIAYLGDKLASESPVGQKGYIYNGIFSTVTFIVGNQQGIKDLLTVITNNNYSSQILTVFTVPRLAIKEIMDTSTTVYTVLDNDFNQQPIIANITVKPTKINDYIPRNKKLLTYPYTYLAFNPPNSNQRLYRFEDFSTQNINFKMISEINPDPTVVLIPQNYLGEIGDSLQNIGTIGGYPTVSQRNDYFNTWLAQNSKQLQISLDRAEFNYEMGRNRRTLDYAQNSLNDLFDYNVGSSLFGSANYIASDVTATKNYEYDIEDKLAIIEAQKLIPDAASLTGSNSTLLGYNLTDNNIFVKYSIKKQFAERIDKYFDMFGYKTNIVKVPDIFNRPNWNYVKTIGVNLTQKNGTWIPQEAIQELKDIFNNGVTFWHDPATFLDYTKNNR